MMRLRPDPTGDCHWPRDAFGGDADGGAGIRCDARGGGAGMTGALMTAATAGKAMLAGKAAGAAGGK